MPFLTQKDVISYDFARFVPFSAFLFDITQQTVDKVSFFLYNDNYSEPCEIPEKDTNHACMNERSFLEFHMARSHIEMQRSGIEMGL